MSEADLAAVRSVLEAMPVEDVDEPRLPMAVALQEANDLATFVGQAAIWAGLVAVGIEPEARERLTFAIGAARTAQSQWAVARDRGKSTAQGEREARGYAQRQDMLAAARWNLRDDRVAMGTLGAIAEGEGIADLVQDLNDLAELVERKAGAFANDRTFDAAAQVEAARSIADEISSGLSGERLDTDQRAAKDLRDRAYSHLDDLVSAIREAGRYGFRGDAKARRRFASPYLRRRRRRDPAPVGDVAPSSVKTDA